jgi:hypothetical protein
MRSGGAPWRHTMNIAAAAAIRLGTTRCARGARFYVRPTSTCRKSAHAPAVTPTPKKTELRGQFELYGPEPGNHQRHAEGAPPQGIYCA